MKRLKALIALFALGVAISLPSTQEIKTGIKYQNSETASIMPSNSEESTSIELSSTVSPSTSTVIEEPSSTITLIEPSTTIEPDDPIEPGEEDEPLFTDFQTFIDWFARVVIPWLVAFFTSGGAGVLIYKIAKMVLEQNQVRKVVSESTAELNAMREKYSKTLQSIKARDEVLQKLIESTLNEQTKAELLELYNSLPSVAELEVSKVTEKIKVKVKKVKSKEVNSNETVSS